MNKAVKSTLWVMGSVVVLALLFFLVIGPMLRSNTKKHSPEQHQTFEQDDLEIKLFYCSPSKKNREIFGSLVPYGEVWRTGANEASTFETNKDLLIAGETLKAGKYSLWTIPEKDTWQIIFNDKMYSWGVRFQDGKAMREEAHDALVATASVSNSINAVEDFNIQVMELEDQSMVLLFSWDRVVVPLPMKVK